MLLVEWPIRAYAKCRLHVSIFGSLDAAAEVVLVGPVPAYPFRVRVDEVVDMRSRIGDALGAAEGRVPIGFGIVEINDVSGVAFDCTLGRVVDPCVAVRLQPA